MRGIEVFGCAAVGAIGGAAYASFVTGVLDKNSTDMFEALGTWVGALGTIGAVAWAIWLASSEARRRHIDEKGQARSMAIVLHPLMQNIYWAAKSKMQVVISEVATRSGPGDRYHPRVTGVALQPFMDLERYLDRLHLLGETGDLLLQIIADRSVQAQDARNIIAKLREDDDPYPLLPMKPVLQRIMDNAKLAEERLGKLAEGTRPASS